MTRHTNAECSKISPFAGIAARSVTLDNVEIERFETLCPSDEHPVYHELTDQDEISELFVLRTCERFECYVRGESLGSDLESVFTKTGPRLSLALGQVLIGDEAIEHLFRVACGLESNILGEHEILGQLRAARTEAMAMGALDGHLETIVQKAIDAGTRSRSETAINEGTVSLGSVAVDRIRAAVDHFADTVMIVVGAGNLASTVIGALGKRDDRPETILVANRSPGAAEELANMVDGETLGLANLPAQAPTADIIVTATTSPTPIITADHLEGAQAAVFDLANPRDVEPAVASLDTIELTTLEEIFDRQNTERAVRRRAIPAVEAIISDEVSRLEEQLRAEQVDAALAEIRRHAEAIRQEELDRALTRFRAENANLSPQQEAVLQDFSAALVSKLLHTPTVSLRQAVVDGDYHAIEQALQLFDTGSASEPMGGNKSLDSSASKEDTERLRIGAESTSIGVSSGLNSP